MKADQQSATVHVIEEGSLVLPTEPAQAQPATAEVRTIRDRKFVTVALLLVMVLVSMEQTITSTAMPSVIGDLHGLEHYSWVASIYLLACTVTMPLYGRLADAFGRKPVILAALLIFCAASLLASFATSMTQLILFRGLQGLGAGGVMPVVLTILADIYTFEERARIQGFFSGVWGTSALAGPALGAVLVKTLGWRSVFWINLPIGLFATAVLAWKYHERRERHEMDLDFPGVASLAIASTLILALVSGMGPTGWSWTTVSILGVVSVIAIAFFVRHERRAAHPILPPELVMRREIGPSILGSMLFGVGFLSLDTYVPLYIQGGRGGDATAAASVVTPVMLTWAMSGLIAAPAIVRFGFRRVATVGATLIVLGFTGLFVCAIAEAPRWMFTATLAVTGFGFGPASMSMLIVAQESVDYRQRGIVTSSISFFRTMGGAVGIGLLGAMFNMLTSRDVARLREHGVKPAALLDPHAIAQIPHDVLTQAQHMIARGLTWVFAAMLIAAVGLWCAMRLLPSHQTTTAVSAADALEVA